MWIKTWERASISLERLRRNRLRSYEYSKNLDIVDRMLQWACDNIKPRSTTGLIEQQRLFMKIGKYTPIEPGKKAL